MQVDKLKQQVQEKGKMVLDILEKSLMITGFVGLMMLVIEYINVITKGAWQQGLSNHRWMQYLVGVVLGITPGCLGAFAVVAMFSHRVVTLGALVATMIATSGDEAFVMLVMFPEKALLLNAILVVIALTVGYLTDLLVSRQFDGGSEKGCQFEIHEPEYCNCFPGSEILSQWRRLSIARGVLSLALILFVLGLAVGSIGPQAWDWKRVTLLIAGLTGLFITITVPEHFLQEHLWNHVALKHIPGIFLWTLGALLVSHVIINQLHLEKSIQANAYIVLLFACLLGIIPESGPHLLFVTLYAQGVIPFAVLLASSIVQDGHGMLPVLAHSRRLFVLVKAINLIAGLVAGTIFYFGDWL
ncbi:MAG: putative manganese transporter [Candidatus Zixiibacteriota bacterium]